MSAEMTQTLDAVERQIADLRRDLTAGRTELQRDLQETQSLLQTAVRQSSPAACQSLCLKTTGNLP